MTKKRSYKRLDFFSTLAVLGVLAVLAFECFFVFELYDRDFESLKRFLPAAQEPAPAQELAPAPESLDESAPVG